MYGTAFGRSSVRDRAAGEADAASRYSSPLTEAGNTPYSTVTLFARLRGWSTSVPLCTAT